MNFVKVEEMGKNILAKFPKTRRFFKKIYQFTMYTISGEKIKSEGKIERISPNDAEYFFGYYDKSPWDATDRYMIALKVKKANKVPDSTEEAKIIVFDTKNNNKEVEIATTHCWNTQQGCMAQWLGPDFKSKIIYNDFRNNQYVSVIYNFEKKIEEKVLSKPVYDVSKDGKFALNLDFSRLHRLRKGYGYANIEEKTKNELCPNKACIWKINLDDGKTEEVIKYTDLKNFENRSEMNGAEHKVNHIMISPNGKRFMVLHRWFKNNKKYTRLVTMNIDGSDMYNLSDDDFVSHCCWKNDEEILSFLNKKKTGNHYYLMKDKTKDYKMLWEELNTDGHCTYSPNKEYIITDTYPNRKRLASVYLCKENGEVTRLARVFSPFKYDNDVRCDLHPRWNHDGNKICIDSVHEGKKELYTVDIEKQDKESNLKIKKKINLLMVFSSLFDGMGICHNVFNYCKYINREEFNIEFVMINEPTPYFKKILEETGDKYYVLPMRNKKQLTYIKKLKEILVKDKIDIIHAHGNSATLALEMLAGKIAKVPVRIAHSRNSSCQHSKADKILRPIFNKSYTDAFAVSNEAGKWLFRDKPYTVIKNGNDIKKFIYNKDNRMKWRKKLNLKEDEVALGHIGTFNERKNQSFAVDIINELNKEKNCKYKLFFIGDGKLKNSVEEKVKNLGLSDKVKFLGLLDNMEEVIQAMDIMLLTSLAEGLPNVLIEWQAACIPSLVSNSTTREAKITELPEYLPLEDGAKKWAKKITELKIMDREKNNEKMISKIQKAGFDVELNAKNLEQIYKKLLYNNKEKNK